MFRILDRYLVREILLPFGIGLVVLTFMMMMPPILDQGQQLIEKGVDLPTVFWILLTIAPSALAITIPMALLFGVLMGLGRLSADREFVALQACGVSIFRAFRPIAVLAFVAFAADQYVLLVALPNANQSFREITFNVVASKAETDVKPRTFYTGFTSQVIYVRDVIPGVGWRDVFVTDTSRADQTTVMLARSGRLLIDRERHRVELLLQDGTQHTTFTAKPEEYQPSSFDRLVLNLDADSVFRRQTLLKGDNEMTIAELRKVIAEARANHQPAAMQLFTLQQKFSIPVSCLVLAAIGLALGASNRKDGTLASFALGSGVIFIYYVLLYMGRAGASGGKLWPQLAPWLVNIVLGIAGAALVVWRAGASGEAVRIPLPRWPRRGQPGAVEPGTSGTIRTAPRERVVVVIRIPQINWPRPTLLDLYVAKQYLSVFLLAFASLLGIFYIATFIDLADKLFRGSTTGWTLLRYFYFQTPQYIYFIIPLAALLSTLVTIGVLTKNSELIVMRACGISIYRSAMPLVLFAVVLSGMLFGLQEYVLADSNRVAGQLNAEIRRLPPRNISVLARRWLAAPNGDIYHYEHYDPARNQFGRFSVFHVDPDRWRLAALTYADEVRFGGPNGAAGWTALRGWDRTFTTTRRRNVETPAVVYKPFAERALQLEPPSYFKTDEPDADRMTFDELQDYVMQMQKAGFYAIPYQVQLQRKVAFPFVTLIMTLLAVPFAVTTGRSGALYGIGIGIALAIVYWTAQSVFGAMGAAGLLAPLLAAWAPNIIFASGAAYMLLTVRT